MAEVKYHTVNQAAEILQLSPSTVWKLISDGELPSVKVGGSRRISDDVLRNLGSTDA